MPTHVFRTGLVSTSRVLTFALLIQLFTITASWAQGPVFGRVEDTETNLSTYHYLFRPGAATIEISALGDLSSPGVYVLEDGVNLAFLLALTGGPDFFIQPDVKVTITIRLFRHSGGRQSLVYEAPFDEVIDRAADTPVLSEGDVITVEVDQKQRLNWRDVFTVVGPILSTLILIDNLTSN